MSSRTSSGGTSCPLCEKPLEPHENNQWDEHLQAILCPDCMEELFNRLVCEENPDQRLIEFVEQLSNRPYYEYQINRLEESGPLTETAEKILRAARARKRRSEFRIIKGEK